jgi:hypothetical protein
MIVPGTAFSERCNFSKKNWKAQPALVPSLALANISGLLRFSQTMYCILQLLQACQVVLAPNQSASSPTVHIAAMTAALLVGWMAMQAGR